MDSEYLYVYRVKVDDEISYYFSSSFGAEDYSNSIHYDKIDMVRIRCDSEISEYIDSGKPRIKMRMF